MVTDPDIPTVSVAPLCTVNDLQEPEVFITGNKFGATLGIMAFLARLGTPQEFQLAGSFQLPETAPVQVG